MLHRLVFVLIWIIPGSLAVAQTPAPPAKERPKVTRQPHFAAVEGDLDTARVAWEIDVKIRQAGEAHADTFLLELSGDRWRTDIIHQIAGSLRASTVRTVVWLRATKHHTVGAGQAMLGLIATECWIDPGTRIERTAGDDRRELAPRGTNHDKLADELMRWAGERRQDRGFDPLLPRLLLGPATPMWAVGSGTSLRITPQEPPTGPDAPSRILSLTRKLPAGETVLVLTAEAAVAVRLALGTATYPVDLFEHRGINPGIIAPLPIKVDLERILAQAAAALDTLDRELEAIETELGSKPRDQRVNTQGFYHDLGARTLKRTAAARERLEACEKMLTDDPEIVRTPPPGASRTTDPDDHAAAWHRALQKRRDQIARLEKKARGFIGR